jgi:uncharacterized protein (DUF2384 family)
MPSHPIAFPGGVLDPEGRIDPGLLIHELRISKAELARACGLSRDAVSRISQRHSSTTQARLGDVAEILSRVLPWAGSVPQAFAWYRAQPLPAFGDQTPEDLVKEGRAEALKTHLSCLALGGHA